MTQQVIAAVKGSDQPTLLLFFPERNKKFPNVQLYTCSHRRNEREPKEKRKKNNEKKKRKKKRESAEGKGENAKELLSPTAHTQPQDVYLASAAQHWNT